MGETTPAFFNNFSSIFCPLEQTQMFLPVGIGFPATFLPDNEELDSIRRRKGSAAQSGEFSEKLILQPQ